MRKSRLLLLDTNAVIKLIDIGAWSAFLSRFEVHLAQTVVDEALFVKGADATEASGETIDLSPDVAAGRVKVFNVPSGRLAAFQKQFKPNILDRLDAGELESLTFLFGSQEHFLIASSDSVVFRVLGCCGREDQGLSVQEAIESVGLSQKLSYQYTRDARIEWSQRGFFEGFNGTAFQIGCSADTCVAAARGVA